SVLMKKRLHLVFCLFAVAAFARSGETIDRIVAVVNGRAVMESEMVESLRFEQLMAGKPPQGVPPEELRAALGRLVDQMLLTQQMDLVHFQQASPDEAQQRMKEVRAQLAPAASDNEWHALLRAYDLDESDVSEHLTQQLRILRFVDARFRPTVRLEPGA